MYIIKNACKSITRNILRNILLGVIVLVIAVSSCVALSIRESAEIAREDTLENLTITAQISFDRGKAMEDMQKPEESSDSAEGSNEEQPAFDRGKFDFDVLQGSTLTLDEYLSYTDAQQTGDSYYYSGALSLDATGDLLPYGTEEETEDSTETQESDTFDDPYGMGQGGPMDMPENMGGQDSMPGGKGGRGGAQRFQINQGDFSITGYSSYDAMLTMFDQDGSYSISDGEIFDTSSADLSCIISNELALYNDLSVGDTLVLCNPDCEEETYTLTICGIYTNDSSSSQEMNRFSMNDPANNIYISYAALEAILSASETAANTTTDTDGTEISAVLTDTLAFTYTFANVDHYEAFSEEIYSLGLSEDYTVSSSDIAAFESSLTPLETLSQTAFWFFLVVLAVGGIILITLNIFNLRERKYEVGVLTAIGMRKRNVALQFVIELFMVTFVSILLGAAIGATISVPVTNALLAEQITSSETDISSMKENFGFLGEDMPMPDALTGDNMDASNGETPDRGRGGGRMEERMNQPGLAANYVDSVTTATNVSVILQLIGVGLFLTIVSSLAALISILRYEPLKILSNRT